MKHILLYPNVRRDPELAVTRAAAELLAREDCLLHFFATLAPPLREQLASLAAPADSLKGMDLVLAFGGDGTILHIAKQAALEGVPILGVNVGNIGFMAEVERDEVPLLPRVLKAGVRVDHRMMLDVEVEREGRLILRDLALNDAVVAKGAVAKIIDLAVEMNGKRLFSFAGDGAVVATPTGSTAYSMSAGGPIVEPEGENLIVTPICAYALHAKSFVFSPEHALSLRVKNLRDRDAYLSVDGGDALRLKEGDVVRVRRSKRQTQLLRFKDHSFYDIMMSKLIKPYESR